MELQLTDIYKSFGKVDVLKGVELNVKPGEIHALMGENGAGKSTLIKVLTGVYKKDKGHIFINGKEAEINTLKDSINLGIVYVHQELSVINEMRVFENVFLGSEIKKNFFLIDNEKMIEKTQELLDLLGVNIDPNARMKDLSVGYQQMVEIAKSLLHKSELIILDEPTAALTKREIESLFEIVRKLQKKGKSFIYVSHRMEEIFELSDRVSILRDGKYIGTKITKDINEKKLVAMMIGNNMNTLIEHVPSKIGDCVLEVSGLTKEKQYKDINFKLHSGEILGFSGLMGSGRTEIMHALFGSVLPDSGKIYIDGKLAKIKSPLDAKKQGIAFVTEDRKEEGLVLQFNIKENIIIPSLPNLSNRFYTDEKVYAKLAEASINNLNIKASSYSQELNSLSGGNQQKVVFAKWLTTGPKIFILDEPTRGVDVGAKKEIYNIINQLKQEGVAIILISSDLPEVMGISDRMVVMHDGEIGHIFNNRDDFKQETILGYAFMGDKYNE